MSWAKGSVIALLAMPLGCGGHASLSDSSSHPSAVGSGGSFAAVTSGGAGGFSAARAGSAGNGGSAGTGGGVSLTVEPPDITSSGQAGSSALGTGIVTVDAGLLDVGLTDAGLVSAGLGDAGCDVMARDISCIQLISENVCAFTSAGNACNVDADCAWLVIPDCCCSAPRYVLGATDTASTCYNHVCTLGFVLPG